MSEDHSLRNGKAQSQTAEFPRDGALALLKGGENFRDLVRLDTDAAIANIDFDLSRLWV